MYKIFRSLILLVTLSFLPFISHAQVPQLINYQGRGAVDMAALVADRTAIEHVYYNHRTGTKPSFEETATLIEQQVKTDLHKETVLQRIYGIEITPAMIEAEVQRINSTTRAPETLAELKHALGDDAERFARSMARPIIVERLLRDHFNNDDKLHASQRASMESLRARLIAAKNELKTEESILTEFKASVKSAEVSKMTWELTPRPTESAEAEKPQSTPTQVKAKAGVYSVEATAQFAQVLSSPTKPETEQKFYFEDLPNELQNVLKVQLSQPGDISAVVEMPTGFVLYLEKAKTDKNLTVTVVSLRKRPYEQWLAEQPI